MVPGRLLLHQCYFGSMKHVCRQNLSIFCKLGRAHDSFLHAEKLFKSLHNHGGSFDALGRCITIHQLEQSFRHPGVDLSVVV